MNEFNSDAEATEYLQMWWDRMRDKHGFTWMTMADLKIAHVDHKKHTVTVELLVEEKHGNAMGNLHGGMTSTLVDVVGSMSIIVAGHPTSGVTTDLCISCLRGAPIGTTLQIHAYCQRLGRQMAFTSIDLLDKATGKMIASGRHTKFLMQSGQTSAPQESVEASSKL
ncbi:hypothetical protein RI367_003712 [Sorochytrium milnesiophthora]